MSGVRLSRKPALSQRFGNTPVPSARSVWTVIAGFCCTLLISAGIGAQENGTLTGIVTAERASPLAQARVTISGTLLGTATGADGTFRVASVPAGSRTLEVRMLGYAPLALPVEILAGETLHLRLLLTAQPVVLTSVEVTADTVVTPQMQGFQARRARGAGTFFNRDEIVRMQPRVFTDVLRRVAGVQMQPSIDTYGSGSSVQIARNSGGMGTRTCPVEFYVNGAPFPLARDGGINHYIAPEEVVAVEVYNGASQIPQQFNSAMYNTRCGVVVIWTRSGPESRSSR